MSIKIKRNDTGIQFTDIPEINGVKIPGADVEGATVNFVLSGTVNGVATQFNRPAEINLVTDPCETAEVAQFSYWAEADVVAETATFKQEWELVYADGTILTFPNDRYNTIKIIPDLG